MIEFDEDLQTMMAALDDEIKHLRQEIEGAEEQVRGIELAKGSLLTNHQRRQLQAAVDNQQEAAQ